MTHDINDILAECEGFQWDEGNATKLRARHRVEPAECEQLFVQIPLLISADEAHSQIEDRWRALGQTADHRLLFVVFAIRSKLIRVLQARPMNRKERQIHDEANART